MVLPNGQTLIGLTRGQVDAAIKAALDARLAEAYWENMPGGVGASAGFAMGAGFYFSHWRPKVDTTFQTITFYIATAQAGVTAGVGLWTIDGSNLVRVDGSAMVATNGSAGEQGIAMGAMQTALAGKDYWPVLGFGGGPSTFRVHSGANTVAMTRDMPEALSGVGRYAYKTGIGSPPLGPIALSAFSEALASAMPYIRIVPGV